uniref:Diguanylate cyclase domain-containing protein n=1 Tax=Desertifilum tharense IPPAS B-1220 TaxID=1781255 RepID=A0ACD5H4G1_9CYAN
MLISAPTACTGSQTDITERKWAEEQLRYQVLSRYLNELTQPRFFIDRLCQALKRVQQNPDAVFAVLFLDLDRFKLINDGLGHTVGDQLLVAIAQRLQSCLRPGDIVARLGGDEFTILLQQMHDISDATRVSERIQEAIALPFYLGTHEVFTTSSIGIVLSTIGYQKPEDLLRDADTAMYRAKARGKSCSQIFDKSMHAHVMAQLQLENDLRQAINDRAFQVYYQPIVALKNGQISGFEALVR